MVIGGYVPGLVVDILVIVAISFAVVLVRIIIIKRQSAQTVVVIAMAQPAVFAYGRDIPYRVICVGVDGTAYGVRV